MSFNYHRDHFATMGSAMATRRGCPHRLRRLRNGAPRAGAVRHPRAERDAMAGAGAGGSGAVAAGSALRQPSPRGLCDQPRRGRRTLRRIIATRRQCCILRRGAACAGCLSPSCRLTVLSSAQIVAARVMLSLLTRTCRINAAAMLAFIYACCALAPSLAFALARDDTVMLCLGASADHRGSLDLDADHHGGVTDVRGDGAALDDAATEVPDLPSFLRNRHAHLLPHETAPGGSHGNSADCCTLFSLSGLFCEAGLALAPAPPVSIAFPALADALSGRGAERINRPPIG